MGLFPNWWRWLESEKSEDVSLNWLCKHCPTVSACLSSCLVSTSSWSVIESLLKVAWWRADSIHYIVLWVSQLKTRKFRKRNKKKWDGWMDIWTALQLDHLTVIKKNYANFLPKNPCFFYKFYKLPPFVCFFKVKTTPWGEGAGGLVILCTHFTLKLHH